MSDELTLTNTREINEKSSRSLKWSFLGELFSKLATPLSTMVLARLLSPEIYGIATAVTLVVTFCETVTESGFAKYLIQHDFDDDKDYAKHVSVALFFSLFLSLVGIVAIYFARYPLSNLVGNAGYEMVLVVASLQIPFAAANAILAAILRRKFSFKHLFYIRILSCLPPFVVSIPLALLGFGHWSLVIGAIVVIAVQTPILIIACRKYIKFYFSFKVLKNMFVFSFAMIVEAILIWFCTWILTFFAANYFDSSAVGLIKVSNSTVASIFNLFSIPFISVLFPTLSRLKSNDVEFENMFHKIQSVAFFILIPLGIGGYFYGNVVTSILLGASWGEASGIVSILSLSFALYTSGSYFLSEVFRSKGHFWSSILFQLVILVIQVALILVMGKSDLTNFILTKLIGAVAIFVLSIFVLKFKYKFHIWRLISSFLISALCSFMMVPLIIMGKNEELNTAQYALQIVVCMTLYVAIYALFFRSSLKNAVSFIAVRKK